MKLRDVFTNFAKRSGLIAASAVIAVSTVAAGVITFTQPIVANATCAPQDSAPQTNIIYCGMTGSTASQLLSSFMGYYNANNDGHGHTDLKAVYNLSGANISGMQSKDMYVGQSYNDGTIHVTINGVDTIVGTNSQIASRCGAGIDSCSPSSRYTHLTSNVYTRAATWFFSKTDTHVQTLVHINPATGMADFAAWTPCGNMLKFTPVQPKKVLSCVSLTDSKKNESDTTASYSFTATASRQYTKITRYDFNFGDSHSQRVTVNDVTTASTSHTYGKTTIQQTVTATVTVSDSSSTVTSEGCQVQIVIPPLKQKEKSLVCVQLDAVKGDSDSIRNFTATASAQNTTISSYTFDFGDGGKQTVNTNAATANASHTYAAGNFTARVSVTGPLGTFTADSCTAPINVQTPPPPLPNTGPGSVIGIFGATTILGGAFHQFVLRRKLNS